MRSIIFLVVSLLVLLSSCNNKEKESSQHANKTNTKEITSQDITKLKYTDYALDEKTFSALENWAPYLELEEVINNVKKET